MGASNQMNRFISNLAKLCAPFDYLLAKVETGNGKKNKKPHFKTSKKQYTKLTETKHFRRNQPVRIICDASKEGLGAVLQQKCEEGWVATHFASRFLTTFEQKHSINELELLAVVWAIESFRNYVYGIQFEIISDQKALTAIY